MRKNYIINIFLIIILIIANGCSKDETEDKLMIYKENCDFWLSEVDETVQSKEYLNIDTLSETEIIFGIECLLRCKGNKNQGKFMGATEYYVSQQFPETTVELAALFYISYIFYQEWEHCDGIALSGNHGEINPKGSIEIAYKYYEKWFINVKSIGLSNARKKGLYPLSGSGIRWYGDHHD